MSRKVLLLRHGEGVHNVAPWGEGGLDPHLTEKGRMQAAALQGDQQLATVELLIVSPLSRAIQTAVLAFGETPKCRVILSPLHSERWDNECDEGRPKSELLKEFPFLERWSGFDDLAEHWTPTGDTDRDWVRRRVPAFLEFVRAQPEQRICVVGHGAFFASLLGRHLRNCEVATLTKGATRNVTRDP